MPDIHPKSPGWYPSPDILPGSNDTLRYWNGRHWTDRHRPVPKLSTFKLGGTINAPLPSALEGPARPAELPAPAAEVSVTRDGPGGLADTLDRSTGAEARGVELPTSTGGGRGIPPQPPDLGGGGGGGNGGGRGDDRPSPGRGSVAGTRGKWWFFAAVGVLCAVVATFVGQALLPKTAEHRVLTDASFVKAANADCTAAFPNLRPADGGAFGSIVTPAQVANQIDQAATGLDNLANKMAAIPAVAVDRPYITTWLDNWHQYDNLGRQYATFLRQHGATNKAPAVLAESAGVAKQADNFANANGLKSCQFTYVDTTNASSM